MITPPALTQCFYTVLFERPSAQVLMKLMTPFRGGDIQQVMITSIDIDSDVLATCELDNGTKKVMENGDMEFDRQLAFNPIYLPINPDDLTDKLDIDKNGDVQAIMGFANPFISAHLQLSSAECPAVIDGRICFKQFVLPSFSEMIETTQAIS